MQFLARSNVVANTDRDGPKFIIFKENNKTNNSISRCTRIVRIRCIQCDVTLFELLRCQVLLRKASGSAAIQLTGNRYSSLMRRWVKNHSHDPNRLIRVKDKQSDQHKSAWHKIVTVLVFTLQLLRLYSTALAPTIFVFQQCLAPPSSSVFSNSHYFLILLSRCREVALVDLRLRRVCPFVIEICRRFIDFILSTLSCGSKFVNFSVINGEQMKSPLVAIL